MRRGPGTGGRRRTVLCCALQACHEAIDIGNHIRRDIPALPGRLEQIGNDWPLVHNGLIKAGRSTRGKHAAKTSHCVRDLACTELNRRQPDRNADQELTVLHCFRFALQLLQDRNGFVGTSLLLSK